MSHEFGKIICCISLISGFHDQTLKATHRERKCVCVSVCARASGVCALACVVHVHVLAHACLCVCVCVSGCAWLHVRVGVYVRTCVERERRCGWTVSVWDWIYFLFTKSRAIPSGGLCRANRLESILHPLPALINALLPDEEGGERLAVVLSLICTWVNFMALIRHMLSIWIWVMYARYM